MKKFKSLASTHIRKIAILLVISTLSSTILCSCGDDKNSTQIETMIEEETEETTTQETSETKTEQTERQNQEADPTEDTTQSTKPTTEQAHLHTWTTETYYTTETQTIHHDAVTHQETVTTYTTETQTIHHDATNGDYYCGGCGAHFTSESAASDHCANGSDECFCAGYSGHGGSPAWDEKVEVQVPHTRTVCSKCGATK